MDGFFDVVAAEQVTNLPLAPALLYRILHDERCRRSRRTVSTVIVRAAPLPADLRAEFTARTGLRVEQGYGLTEAAPGVSATFGGADLDEHGHVGRPLPGVEVRIGDGTDEAEPGEIAIRGDNLFSGYWPDGAGGPAEDGWFATGDIGYLRDGELFLVDRARELIIVNGFNVYPARSRRRSASSRRSSRWPWSAGPTRVPGSRWWPSSPGRGSPPSCQGPLRGPAGQVQATRRGPSRRRTAARGDRQGAEGPAAARARRVGRLRCRRT